MKILIQSFAVLSVVFLFASCGGEIKTVDKPADIGPQVFAVLEDMDEMTKDQFRQHFLTIEDIHAMAKDENLGMSKEMSAFFLAQNKKEYDEDLNEDFKKIDKKGKKLGIEWTQIEYVKFTSKIRIKGEIKQCDGEMTFKYRKTHFVVDTRSLYDESGWSLLNIGKPKKSLLIN
jgi:hypothetical protein